MDESYERDRAFLPLKRRDHLVTAIGLRLTEIERRLYCPSDEPDIARYVATRSPANGASWFSVAPGQTTLHFEGGVTHALAFEPEWLSVLVLDAPYPAVEDYGSYRLAGLANEPLKACLGRRCLQVRVWFYDDGGGHDEIVPCHAAVSYQLEDVELFYGGYVHEAETDDARLWLGRSESQRGNVHEPIELGGGR
jgi:hypothetical protein